MLRSVTGRSILYRFLGDTIGKLVSFLVVVTIARKMGAAATGIYALANVLADYVSVIPDLGMNLFMTREIAAGKVRAERLVGALLLVKIVASAWSGVHTFCLWKRIYAFCPNFEDPFPRRADDVC